jgi:hypothetical protein
MAQGEGGVINPYLRCQPTRMPVVNETVTEPTTTCTEQVVTIRPRPINPYLRPPRPVNEMPQSQWRKSSILACKQKAAMFRGPRTFNRDDGRLKTCCVCKVKQHNNNIEKQILEATKANKPAAEIEMLKKYKKKIPHRAHIQNCPGNTSKKKPPTNSNVVPPTLFHGLNFTPTLPLFTPTIDTADAIHQERWKATPLATELRTVLQERMQDGEYINKLKACRAPLAIAVLVDYIDSTFSSKRHNQNLPASDIFVDKYDQYRRFFQPGSIAFVFPHERRDRAPHPNYHAIEGATYLHVDWTMSHPDITLRCVENGCAGQLKRVRFAYQKNKTLLPIIQQQNHCIWANIMKYQCAQCNQPCAANDGRLLASLPIEVARCYPVKPRYAASGNDGDKNFFQMSVELSEDLEDNILTYANANVFSRKIWKRILRDYERRILDYYSIAKTVGHLHGPYISLFEFCGKFYAPSGEQLYTRYNSAERSILTSTGVSEFDRHRRELIGIGCDGLTAIDWTFSVCKNYAIRDHGAATCFTMNNDAGQVAAAFLVQSTKVGEVAHGVQLVSKRINFNPKVVATDTWPAKRDFWLGIFTTATTGMLGLFHFMKRIVDTLRITNSKFHHALRDLKDCVYGHEADDYAKLIGVLQQGTMSRNAEPMTHAQIEDLKKTAKWNQRYSRFLRKKLHLPPTIRQKLLCWVDKYKECRDPLTDQHLFVATAKAVDRQLRHLEHIQWPTDVEMYVRIPPGPKTTHGLHTYRSRNPEPQLESFHAQFANFGNSRMSDVLGDNIHLRGIAARNLKIQHITDVREGRVDVDLLPGHLADIPLIQDHHLGNFINNIARAAGCSKDAIPFPHLKPLAHDTGEVFLTEYFYEQMERNQFDATKPDPANDFCRCCVSNRNNDNTPDVNHVRETNQAADAITRRLPLLLPRIGNEITVPVPEANTTLDDIIRYLPLLPPRVDNEFTNRFCTTTSEEFCCDSFRKYHLHKLTTGRYKPGRVPHEKHCQQRKKEIDLHKN